MKLYIIYGSESSVLKNIYNNESYFIRIYNKSTPEVKKNCLDISIKKIQQTKLEIKNIILKHNISKYGNKRKLKPTNKIKYHSMLK